eukprot:PhF_6_TR6937/c2_g1_i1/m.10158
MEMTQGIEGLVAFVDSTSIPINPLTVTEILNWMGEEENIDAAFPVNKLPRTERGATERIRRLESMEGAWVMNAGTSALHDAANNGHADCIHALLSIDPTMT